MYSKIGIFFLAAAALSSKGASGFSADGGGGVRRPARAKISCKKNMARPVVGGENAHVAVPQLGNPLTAFAGASVLAAGVLMGSVGVAFADGSTKEFKLPPIDFSNKSRCTILNSKMGQANAARDKLFDLRQCKLSGADASGYDLSGVIMTDTDLSKSKLVETQFSKGYMHDSNFDGADFSNGIIDRASFQGSSMKGAIFTNAVLTGTGFDGADLTDSDFTDTYLGDFDSRRLCKNPTLDGENPVTGADTRASAGCGARKR